jgi:predicted porin
VKRIIAVGLASMAVVSSAWAQSSVTLYGSMDAGVAYISNVGGSTKWEEENGNTQPDRWGLKGVEDLGGGLDAVFQLENGFYTNTGAMASAGTLWNRMAFVGLGAKQYGTITLGRQAPFMFDVLGPLSTGYQAASWFAFHPGNLDELADTSVVPFNNSVKFRSASFGGFSFGAMMGLGNETNFATGRTMSFTVAYANGPLKAGAVYEDANNRTFTLATTGLTEFQGMPAATYEADKVETMGAGASYQFGRLRVHGLYTRVKFENPGYSDTYQSYDAGANYAFTSANTVAGGASTTSLAGHRWTQFELGDIYALSKATQLYANILYERANAGTYAALYTAGVASGQNQMSVLAGIHHSF